MSNPLRAVKLSVPPANEASHTSDLPSPLSPIIPSTKSGPSLPTTSSATPSTSSPHTTAATESQIYESRLALQASLSNIGSTLDSSLRGRAQTLHSNAASLETQQKQLENNTKSLSKETEKFKKVVDEGVMKLKELGNVQNWAEMLERDFLVVEETLRLVQEGEERERNEGWETDSGSWSGSTRGSSEGESDEDSVKMDGKGVVGERADPGGDTNMLGNEVPRREKGKGREGVIDESNEVENIKSHPSIQSTSGGVSNAISAS